MSLIEKLIGRVIRQGELTVVMPGGERKTFGQPEPGGRSATIHLRDRKVIPRLMRNPRLAVGEAYMDGDLEVEGDVHDFLDLVTFNARWEKGGGARHAIRKRGIIRGKLDQLNWKARSKRNVAHHYDIGNELYELFLDRDLQYTCAYFTDPGNSIEQAQDDKKAHLVSKLRLEPGQKVLDIGSGWGGLALYMNQVADVDVLGITLSQEQLVVARQRASDAGVADRVRFELMDYRDLTGSFDRITAIGVIEHVGPPDFDTFFNKCRDLLKEDGILLLHFLGRLGKPGTTDPWTAKYIFPGGYNPSLSQIIRASEQAKLISADIEQLRVHYAHTCRRWLEKTRAAKERIVEMYDERFFRMWEFYLAGSITAFENGGCCNYQIQYVRDRYAVPITRDYMIEQELVHRSELARARGEPELRQSDAA